MTQEKNKPTAPALDIETVNILNDIVENGFAFSLFCSKYCNNGQGIFSVVLYIPNSEEIHGMATARDLPEVADKLKAMIIELYPNSDIAHRFMKNVNKLH